MKNKVVLVVDDSWEIIETIANGIKKIAPAYELINAANGKIACDIAIKKVPDLIIMDWDMPVMSGIDALRQLKSMEITKDIPVIIASGKMITSENLNTALSVGAVDYIRKPIDFIELEARMNSAVNIKHQQDEIKSLMANELDLKSRKLSAISMHLLEKNQLLRKFKMTLEKLHEDEGINDAMRAKISSMIKEINQNLELDESWNAFKMHFEEVYSQFFKSIELLYPDISQKDLKLCAYIRLGIDNKEISRLLNVVPASISTAMYRLKKKLDITKQRDLREFILTIV